MKTFDCIERKCKNRFEKVIDNSIENAMSNTRNEQKPFAIFQFKSIQIILIRKTNAHVSFIWYGMHMFACSSYQYEVKHTHTHTRRRRVREGEGAHTNTHGNLYFSLFSLCKFLLLNSFNKHYSIRIGTVSTVNSIEKIRIFFALKIFAICYVKCVIHFVCIQCALQHPGKCRSF